MLLSTGGAYACAWETDKYGIPSIEIPFGSKDKVAVPDQLPTTTYLLVVYGNTVLLHTRSSEYYLG